MIGHLGSRVSALLDGQLDPVEEERAWAHVHACHQCRDLVEREGWVKTRLAGLAGPSGSARATGAPAGLRGALRDPLAHGGHGGGDGDAVDGAYAAWSASSATRAGALRHRAGMAVLGGGALSAAVVGVLALGVAPSDPSAPGRRAPLTDLSSVRDSPRPPASTPSTGPSTRPSPASPATSPPASVAASSGAPSASAGSGPGRPGPRVPGRWGDRG